MRERYARSALITFATAALLVLGSAAGAAEQVGRLATGAEAGTSYTVTLITGDRVHIQRFPDGRQAATIDPSPRGDDLPEPTFETIEGSGDLYVIPSDAARYLDEKLDRDLFNVTELVAQGLHDEATESLPVIVDYKRTVRDLPTPLNAVDTLESIDAVAAREPSDKATSFGRALAEQARRDDSAGGAGARAAAQPELFAGVDKIWLDAKVEADLSESVPQIGTPVAWEAGYDGTGVTVAVLDTGIDATHPDLAGKVADARNFTTSSTVTDRNGHGTHVASTIAGSGAASAGARKGVAPGASLLNGKVLGDGGSGPTSGVIAGMEWAARDKDADIVSMSLGTQSSSDGTDPMSQAVNALTAETSALFVVAAGNRGPNNQTVESPGAATSALTVGAVDKSNVLASFSARGPRLGDFAIKPDITAPGVDIGAARAAGTSRGTPIDEFYTRLSGTSMATPHVAGAAALFAQRHSNWDADALKPALITTASPGAYTVYQQGSGRVDVARAFTQPEVLATPAPLDLGFFRWPHENRAPVTKTVTYTNRSDAGLTLELSLELADESGNPAAPGMVTGSPQSLTLAPGASQEVQVTLDTTVGAVGLYGGSLVAEDEGAGAVLRTPVGFYKEPERYDLTVVGIDRNGQPPGIFSSVRLANVDDFRVLFDPFLNSRRFVNGTTTYRVPPGTWTVFAPLISGTSLFETFAFVIEPEVTVREDTTVVLDAREASEITVAAEQHATATQRINFGYYRRAVEGGAFVYTFSGIGPIPVFASPTEPVTKGALEFYSRWRLVDPATISPQSPWYAPATPYLFDLVFPEAGVIPETMNHVVDENELTTITNAIHSQEVPQEHREYRHKWRPYEIVSVASDMPVQAPIERTEYVTPGDTEWQQSVCLTYPSCLSEPFTTYEPGTLAQSWLKQALRPEVSRASRAGGSGNSLVFSLTPLSDAANHSGTASGLTMKLRLLRNGALLGQRTGNFAIFTAPPEPSDYRLEFEVDAATAPWAKISKRMKIAWSFASQNGAAELPLLEIDYGLALDLRNRALLPQDAKGRHVIDLHVRHQPDAAPIPIAGLRLWVTYDDGVTWKPIQNVQALGAGRFRATLDQRDPLETNGYVGLKTEAWDTAGNRIEQELVRAYALTPRD